MLQTVFIIIHLILIALVWSIVRRTHDFIERNGYRPFLNEKEAIDRNETKKLLVKEFCLIGIGVCLNIAIFYWVKVNQKPEWYGNYMWFVLLVPVSIFIAALCSGFSGEINELIIRVSGSASLCFLLTCLWVMIFGVTVPGNAEKSTETINIVNINNGKEEGNNKALLYSLNDENKKGNAYIYYYRGKNKKIERGIIPESRSKIYYLQEGETQGYIEKITTTRYKYEVKSYPAVKTDKIDSQSERYKIYIPEGSIGQYELKDR